MFKEKLTEFLDNYGGVILFFGIGAIAVGSCIGCDNHQSKINKERERTEFLADSLKKDSTLKADKKDTEIREIFSDSISSKYNAYYKSCLGCDADFSSEIQKEIARFDNRVLIRSFEVNDIYFKDTLCYIMIKDYPCIITIKTTASFYNEFIEYKDNSFLLLNIENVKKAALSVSAEGDGSDANVVISPSNYFLINADLIDIIPSTKR